VKRYELMLDPFPADESNWQHGNPWPKPWLEWKKVPAITYGIAAGPPWVWVERTSRRHARRVTAWTLWGARRKKRRCVESKLALISIVDRWTGRRVT